MAAAVFGPWYPASAKIHLMKGKKRRVRRLRTSRAPSRSCIAAEWTTIPGAGAVPQERHAAVWLWVEVGGLCRTGQQPHHGRYRFSLCRPCAGRCNDVGHERETEAPVLCAGGIVAEFLAGFAGYYAVGAVRPNFYYTPITAGKGDLARTAGRLHRNLRRRRDVRVRRHQTRLADSAPARPVARVVRVLLETSSQFDDTVQPIERKNYEDHTKSKTHRRCDVLRRCFNCPCAEDA
jgi:hypothetical protein